MAVDPQHQVTRLLEEAQAGRSEAVGELFQLVYGELHTIARRKMSLENPGNLLQPTALVNETYLRLFGSGPAPLKDRQHFFCVASTAMRQILIDVARADQAKKRGGRPVRVELEEWMRVSNDQPNLQIDLEKAVEALAAVDPRCAEIMQLFIYGGREAAEIAELYQVARRTVEREIASGRLFLKRFLQQHAVHS